MDQESSALHSMDRLDSMRRSQEVAVRPWWTDYAGQQSSVTILDKVNGVEREEDEDLDWDQIYSDIRASDPDEFDRLKEYYIGEGYDDESATYWAAYYVENKSMYQSES